jgi:hypothetical protein
MTKLTNFPAVNYITLYENTARMEFMNAQLTKYGIYHVAWMNHRYTEFQDTINITWPPGTVMDNTEFQKFSHPGTIISYLNAMKNWYDTTNDEYAIFCDDDMSFESIDYWNFTWQEFLDALPQDWDSIQLVRINNWNVGLINNAIKFEIPSLQIRKREWDDFGGAGLFKRAYVKKILDRHWIDSVSFNFTISDVDKPFFYYATIENVLFRELSQNIYNIPLLVEHPFSTTLNVPKMAYSHDRSYEYYSTLWKMYGTDLPLRYIMNQS